MEHESYVPLDTAKLLKQAGFDWKEYFVAHSINEHFHWEIPLHIAQKWLREVKEYSVFCTPTTRTKWCFVIMCPDTQLLEYAKDYDTYESALKVCINKCLTLILEKDVN